MLDRLDLQRHGDDFHQRPPASSAAPRAEDATDPGRAGATLRSEREAAAALETGEKIHRGRPRLSPG